MSFVKGTEAIFSDVACSELVTLFATEFRWRHCKLKTVLAGVASFLFTLRRQFPWNRGFAKRRVSFHEGKYREGGLELFVSFHRAVREPFVFWGGKRWQPLVSKYRLRNRPTLNSSCDPGRAVSPLFRISVSQLRRGVFKALKNYILNKKLFWWKMLRR